VEALPLSSLKAKRPAAPNFNLPRLDGDGTVELAAIKKPRVVDFFASWCYACPYESKAAREIFASVRERDRLRRSQHGRLQLRREAVRAQVRPHVHDRPRAGPEGVEHLGRATDPRIFFIDRNGKVIGQMQAEEDLPRFLKQLAANKA